MLAVGDEMPIDTIGGVLIILVCLVLIAFGKESATINAVMFTIIGKLFGKYQKKIRR